MTAVDISNESKIPEDEPKPRKLRKQVVVRLVLSLLSVCGAGWLAISSADDAERSTPPSVALDALAPGDSMASDEHVAIGANDVPIALIANFHVDIRVRPAHAQILLDGNEVGRGRLQLELPRDGHVHEIRILADGYAPERLVFADASPQREVVLTEEDEEGQAPESPTARRPPRAAPPAARAGARHEAAPAAREQDVKKEALGSPLPADIHKSEPAPSVRIIEDEGPNVRVVE